MKNIFKTILSISITLLVLVCSSYTASAQFDRSLHFLPLVPQGRNVNPAFIPEQSYYIGVPFLSSVKTGFENSINYDDIFLKVGDSLVLDRDHILSNFDDKTNININFMEEYFSFGFTVKKNYFHFRVADIIQSNVVINKEMLRFLLYGNGSPEFLGQNVNIGDNLVNLNYYREYSFGYTRQINEKFTAGVNLKYLQGIANVSTNTAEISLYTDPTDFALSLQTNIEINISSPGLNDTDLEPSHFLPNAKNGGFAFDLGAQYIINDKFEAFASMLNMGSIKWTENLKNFKTKDPEKVFTFEGFDIGEYFEDNKFDNDRIESVLDSISDEIGIKEGEDAYKTQLAPLLNIGGRYNLTENDEFSLLFRNQFLKTSNWATVSIAYTRRFGKSVNLMASNTFFKDSYFNPGIGFAANIGPVQLYLINENIIAPFMLSNSNAFLIRFGINLIFNKGDGKTKDIDVIKEG